MDQLYKKPNHSLCRGDPKARSLEPSQAWQESHIQPQHNWEAGQAQAQETASSAPGSGASPTFPNPL